MGKKISRLWVGGAVVLVAALMVGCGSNGATGSSPAPAALSGSVVTFGTDQPICDVESFIVTITSATLGSQSGGQSAALITSAAPATVDFGRLTDFTNILYPQHGERRPGDIQPASDDLDQPSTHCH